MFQELNTEIALGDTVIAYISPENKWHFTVGDGKENCRVGSFSHSRMIGRKWGEKLISDGAKGFLTLLKPSPELWTRTLRHRTQILYTPDIAFIEIMLDLKIGSRGRLLSKVALLSLIKRKRKKTLRLPLRQLASLAVL
jgi:tRNA (adenine57-N1/adenine58-N1)-methyltransferase